MTKTAFLGGVVQRGLVDGPCLVDLHRVEALPGVMVASAAGLARGFAPIGMLKLGWRKRMEATSGACAQGTISALAKEPATAVDGVQGPVPSVVCASCSVLVGSACTRSL